MKIQTILSITFALFLILMSTGTYSASAPSRKERLQKYQVRIQPAQGIDQLDKNGTSALGRAVAANNISEVVKLLEAGANPNVPNSRGVAPLHLALDNTIIEELLSHGANIESKSRYKTTRLQMAVDHTDEKTIEQLLRAGANPNAKNRMGQTPFQLLVKNISKFQNWIKMVNMFLDYGADPLQEDLDGDSALGLAVHAPNAVLLLIMKSPAVSSVLTSFNDSPEAEDMQKLIHAKIHNLENDIGDWQTQPVIDEEEIKKAQEEIKILQDTIDMLKNPKKYLTQETEVGNILRKELLKLNPKQSTFSGLQKREIGYKRPPKKEAESDEDESASSSSSPSTATSKRDEGKKD